MPAVAYNGGHAVERIVDGSDGKFHILKTQDCSAVLTAMREIKDVKKALRPSTQDSTKLIGSVPNLLAVSWANEWGVTLFSKEWTEKARKRLKSDPDWRLLRADH